MPNAEMMHTAAMTINLINLPIEVSCGLVANLKYLFFDKKQVVFYNLMRRKKPSFCVSIHVVNNCLLVGE